ncbi:MAG: hypothetical protein WB660_28320 [Candidatus Sulfotelmatobacter sp.]
MDTILETEHRADYPALRIEPEVRKENGDHSAQVTAGNAMAAYERQRDNDTGLALSALVQVTIAAEGIPQA